MALKKLKRIDFKLITKSNEKSIIFFASELLNLKIKKITNQEFKSHKFKDHRQQISQLLSLKHKNTSIDKN
jgi:ribosomal protein L29